MHRIERNGKSKLEEKLLTPASWNNGIEMHIAVDSHIRYACQIWGQIQSKTFDIIQHTQNKALQFMEPSEARYN